MKWNLSRLPQPALFLALLIMQTMPATQAIGQQRCDTSVLPLSVPTTAFTDHGDGTVTDQRSRLQWMRCSVGQQWSAGGCSGQASAVPLQVAKEHADRINAAGTFFFNDWRLPNLRELATIVERQCSPPRTNLQLFPQTPAGDYWTSVARAVGSYEPDVFTIGFGAQGVGFAHPSSEKHARLVRTAQ
jgi:hypothetical protein